MTSRERMITAFKNRQPDMVPVSPDMSNMIPARLTGQPFWDIYLYNDPPLEDAYIEAVRHFGFDGWSDKGALTVIPCGDAGVEPGSRPEMDGRRDSGGADCLPETLTRSGTDGRL